MIFYYFMGFFSVFFSLMTNLLIVCHVTASVVQYIKLMTVVDFLYFQFFSFSIFKIFLLIVLLDFFSGLHYF